MSIPKEKLIIQEIKDVIDRDNLLAIEKMAYVKSIIKSYSNPGYTTGPIVGIPEEAEEN